MDALNTWNQVTQIDWKLLIGILLLLAIFIVAVSKLAKELVEVICKTFGIKSIVTQKSQDHDMLLEIKQSVEKLSEKQEQYREQSERCDIEIRDNISEIRNTISEIKDSQSEMKAQIEDLSERHDDVRNALMEVMCDRIEQKAKIYIKDNGIPQDEYDSFVKLYEAYRHIDGNSTAKAKFEYCMTNLKILK